MKLQAVVDEIKLNVTGGLLELEIDDKTIKQYVKAALRTLERYWDETTLITVPFASCINYGSSEIFKEKVSAIVKIYRAENVGNTGNDEGLMDPLYAQQWMIFGNGGAMYNLNDYVLNYAAWNTLLQTKNTMSTDLAFRDDRHSGRLYINSAMDLPKMITIEYIPKLTKVDDIKSDYWIDILIKYSTALTKIALGRIRTRFDLSNAQWGQDGDKLLEEGLTEQRELDQRLNENSNLIFGID